MVDVKLGNLTFEGVDSVKLNTTDGQEVVFTLKSGEEVDPNVIKVDLNNRVCSTNFGVIIVKVADEPFRTDPDVPIELTRIGKVQFAVSPFFNYSGTDGDKSGEQEEYLSTREGLEVPWSVELGEGTYDDHLDEGFESIYMDTPVHDFANDYFVRVPESAPNLWEMGVTIPKGLYIVSSTYVYPSSFEVLPAQS